MDQVKDPYWKKALSLFNELSEKQRELFFEAIKQVQIDTIAHFFGILDGSSYLNEERAEFSLTIIGDEKPLNGDLQELFFEVVEGEQNK